MKTDVRALLQTTLDHAFDYLLIPVNIRVFWNRRSETAVEDPDEYIVYTLDSDPYDSYADDEPLTRTAEATVRYYYRDTFIDTRAGRAQIKSREAAIETALRSAGFTLPQGGFDAGDIDDIGFGTVVFPAEYWEVV